MPTVKSTLAEALAAAEAKDWSRVDRTTEAEIAQHAAGDGTSTDDLDFEAMLARGDAWLAEPQKTTIAAE